jgi:hypothetical protein
MSINIDDDQEEDNDEGTSNDVTRWNQTLVLHVIIIKLKI